MKTPTNRKLAAIAASASIVLSAVALAPSAAANSTATRGEWSGYLDCSGGRFVTAEGGRNPNEGTMWLSVPGQTLHVGIGETQKVLVSTQSVGAWEVGGTAATWGAGYCS